MSKSVRWANRRPRSGHPERLRAIVVVLSILSIQGALAQKITTRFDAALDFSKFKTFAIRDDQLSSRSPALNSELAKRCVEAEIGRALTAKGLTQENGKADLNVFYHLGSARRAETETYPAGWRGLGTRVARVPYSEGTLIVDFRDPRPVRLSGEALPRNNSAHPAKLADKLDDMVRKSLAKYPPKK